MYSGDELDDLLTSEDLLGVYGDDEWDDEWDDESEDWDEDEGAWYPHHPDDAYYQ